MLGYANLAPRVPKRGLAGVCVTAVLALIQVGAPFAAAASLTVLHRFPTADNSGFRPGAVIQATDGHFYGTTEFGGGMGCGTLYRMASDGSHTQLRVFGTDPGDACHPVGRLLQGLDGKLYGASRYGMAGAGLGTVYRIATDGTGYEVLHRFNDADGNRPNGSLVQSADGSLYGTTLTGGANGNGVIFKLAVNGTLTVLHSFAVVPEGPTQSSAGLLLASDGNLYGTLESGPTSDGGVFGIGQDGTGYALIHQFAGNPNGVQSENPLVEGSDGLLYGVGHRYVLVSSTGNSSTWRVVFVVFRMLKDGTAATDLAVTSSDSLYGGLAFGPDGKLYGIAGTTSGNHAGGLYSLATDGTGFSVFHTFGTSADSPYGPREGLIRANDDKLYGATQRGGTANGGGADGAGALFSVTTATSAVTTLHSFGTHADGYRPVSALALGGNDALYGATSRGGMPYLGNTLNGSRGSEGTVFRMNSDGGTFALLHSFTFANGGGSVPLGTPLLGFDGTLYGTTRNGGGGGTVWRVPSGGGTASLVHSFQFCSPCAEGFHPSSGVVQAADGALYGASDFGGTGSDGNGLGVIYRVNPDGTGYAALRSFMGGADGKYPAAVPTLASDGRLYGTTAAGGGTNCSGSGCGTVYGINVDGGGYAMLHAFAGGSDASIPKAALLEGADGYLYGTTSAGGGAGCGGTGCGTVFRITKDGSGYLVLHAFAGGNDGAVPLAGLVQAPDGALYGTTREGGSTGCGGGGCGIVYRLTPDAAYNIIYSFAGDDDGRYPHAGLVRASDGRLFGTTARGGGLLDGGTAFELIDNVTTTLPSPTDLVATPGNGRVTLAWSASAGAASYRVLQGVASGEVGGLPVATGITGTSTTVDGLANGTTYYFAVQAVSGVEHSALSNEASAQPVPAPVITVAAAPASIVHGQSATLTWSSAYATDCTASNAWSGVRDLSGSATVTPASPGIYVYTLSCNGYGGTTTQDATLAVTQEKARRGGGGAFGGMAMLMALPALLRRRMRQVVTQTAVDHYAA